MTSLGVDFDVFPRVGVFFEDHHFGTHHVVIGELFSAVVNAVRLVCQSLAAEHFVLELDVGQLIFQLCCFSALYNDLVFEVTLAEAKNVVRGSDTTQLKYKLTNIQLEFEMLRSKTLADEAHSFYSSGKEFAYDHVMRSEVVTFKKETKTRINIKVDAQKDR